MNKLAKLALTATLGPAITLTLFSCGNHTFEELLGLESSSSSEQAESSSSSLKLSSSSSSLAPSSSSGVTYQGETYQTVVIGEQTWFQRNLNYDVDGSKCYNNDPANCAKYGRLYDWATAMKLPSKCSEVPSISDPDCAISASNHQGICPSGWHIPSNAEWDNLYRSVDGATGTDSLYESSTAGKYLKAKEGWTNCGSSGSGKANLCEDTKGFSALPGGGGFLDEGIFDYVGEYGFWWSSSEYDAYNAYRRRINYNYDGAYLYNDNKSILFSVRCLQDSPYSYSSSAGGGGSSSSSEYTGGSCDASDYGTVDIGGQIWMAKNWGCYAPGSKCYDNDPANCAKYGRLYDWATAMGISSNYNSRYYNPSSSTKHQGVCPSGWHIPSDAEWDALYRSIDRTGGTDRFYTSPTAGRDLKAKEGWDYCGPYGSGQAYFCEDTKGFTALPGGYGNSKGIFGEVGRYGYWWSSYEWFYDIAYNTRMENFSDVAGWYRLTKSHLYSVRCIQD